MFEENDSLDEDVIVDMDEKVGFDMSWHSPRQWVWGLVLIFGGAILLVQNLTDVHIINAGNWWVVFIIVPGINLIITGLGRYRRGRHRGSSIIWGGLLVLFGLSFLFDVNFDLVWPVFLIAGGILLLFGSKR